MENLIGISLETRLLETRKIKGVYKSKKRKDGTLEPGKVKAKTVEPGEIIWLVFE